MPSAYGLGKNIIFNKVQFSSVQFKRILINWRKYNVRLPDLSQETTFQGNRDVSLRC